MNRILTSVIAMTFLFGAGVARSETVMDFEALSSSGDGSVTSPYVEDGFSVAGDHLYRYGTSSQNFLGSTGLEHDNPADIIFSKVGGGSFDIISIDLGPIPQFTEGQSQNVTITGNLSGGGAVGTTFAVTGASSFQTFLFPSTFVGLESVTWNNSNPYHQFDNITVADGTTAVPEPGTFSLWLGLLSLGFIALRRSRA